ncbi:MAG TPA: hypothetical protein VMW50_08815 [Dehalococcoidia bacterium]|nr:hypothetical protein [Dehalococcoidia bacterium]
MANDLVPERESKEIMANLQRSIASVNEPLAIYLGDIGLPVENILQPLEERNKVLTSLKSIVQMLGIEERTKAHYLSKFAITAAIGLFDGSLNYLWDEAIKCLRKNINSFDLFYFFNVATSVSGRYRNFKSEDDLELISDHDLLEICRRLGLISEINYFRLEHVNYLRNHASAAHPNENDVSGFELVSNLETCIKYAIKAEPDHSSIQMKRLLSNIRAANLPAADIPIIGGEIELLSQIRIDDLLFTFFGMFCDDDRTPIVETNIKSLAAYVFENASNEKKLEIGAKYGLYRKLGDISRKEKALKFLESVDGLAYRDEDSLAAELIEKTQELKSVHFDVNNFYNEYGHAKNIETSIPPNGSIPKAAKNEFVKVICICYIGNGLGYRDGTCEAAVPYYEKYIDLYQDDDIIQFIKLFKDSEFINAITGSKQDRRTRLLISKLKNKTRQPLIIELLGIIEQMPNLHIQDVAKTSEYKTRSERLFRNRQ